MVLRTILKILDEQLHLVGTQHILNMMREGIDDPEFIDIVKECEPEAREMFMRAINQEKDWAAYLFKDGSMIGLNKEILSKYVEFIANQRLTAIGMPLPFPESKSNPIPWVNAWLTSDDVQVAPQEVEIMSYQVGQIDSTVSADDLEGLDL